MERLQFELPRSALNPMRGLLIAIALVIFVGGCSDAQTQQTSAKSEVVPLGTGFDFYVLSLSWSPGYCASEGGDADANQCGGSRRYAFVVHGLWPQYARGYPSDCNSSFGEKVDNKLATSMTDIMPSFGLIRHQWKKHGRCSGLSQQDYFDVTRAAFGKITTPPSFAGLRETKTIAPQAVEKLFQAENKSVPADAIAVTCKGNYMRDVRICMSKDLANFVSCAEVDRNSCKSNTMAVAPIR
ncbi:MAG: ribonuclease T [Ahrensia sp.]|nr:ribonuclease T [Ahrensia sp.]